MRETLRLRLRAPGPGLERRRRSRLRHHRRPQQRQRLRRDRAVPVAAPRQARSCGAPRSPPTAVTSRTTRAVTSRTTGPGRCSRRRSSACGHGADARLDARGEASRRALRPRSSTRSTPTEASPRSTTRRSSPRRSPRSTTSAAAAPGATQRRRRPTRRWTRSRSRLARPGVRQEPHPGPESVHAARDPVLGGRDRRWRCEREPHSRSRVQRLAPGRRRGRRPHRRDGGADRAGGDDGPRRRAL